MLYTAYELGYAAISPARIAAGIGARMWRSPFNPIADSWLARTAAASLDMFEHASRRYPRPEWKIEETVIGGVPAAVEVETVLHKDFGDLVHFRRDEDAVKAGGGEADPKVLIVAPLSGHYATLLRGTVEAMLPSHDVYITDWIDARHVPIIAGRFDLNTYIDYVMDFLREIGPGAHAIAVCQPGPAVLSAAAVLAEENDPARPSTLTIMGSPIDARRSPTVPNLLAQERPFEWFESNMIHTVPAPYAGMLRRVYPGFIQLYSFLSMNSDRHVNAHYDYFEHLVTGDGNSADKHRQFYDEYLSVMDMTEEFYLQTISEVFQKHSLPKGELMHNGRKVRPDAMRDIGLMTVEGERDDISGIGQTQAAHDLCLNIPDRMKIDYVQEGVGHYGVFNGSRWRKEIQPKVQEFIRAHDRNVRGRQHLKLVAQS